MKRLVVAAAAATTVTVLGACSSPAVRTSKAAHDGLAATATARQALDQQQRGRTVSTTLDVALGDAATELSAALSRTATIIPESNSQDRDLLATRTALADAAAAVATARSFVATGEEDLTPARQRVDAAESDLRRVVDELGPPR